VNTKTTVKGGVNCADFIGRDQHNQYGFSAEDVAALIERVLTFLDAGATFIPERTADGWGTRLEAEINGERLIFHPGAVGQLSQSRDLQSYLLSLTVHRDYQIWATKFIPLAAQIVEVRKIVDGLEMPIAFSEFRPPEPGAGPGAQASTVPLENITEALTRHNAFVILGEPGCGKTTTLQKITFDAARHLLSGEPGRVPLFVRLSQQRERDPYTFLAEEWERRTGTDFGNALAAGKVLILADGVNEIQRETRDERLKAWRLFAGDYAGGNQIAFSGRERDYDHDQQLDLPRVLVDPLDDARITDYLQRHNVEGLGELLDDTTTRLRQMASNPFNLALLTFAYKSNQRDMANLGWLLHWFVGELFSREERLAHPGWLPRAVQIQALAQLAYTMQEQGESLTFPLKTARQAIPETADFRGEATAIPPARLFRFGRAATLLDPGIEPDVRFYHHLLQEYFAALELLRRFREGADLQDLWACKRLAAEMPPADVGEWDALPEPPPTGWEVTTILACGLAGSLKVDLAALIEAVRAHNPVLAGRCLHEAGIEPPEESLDNVRADLLADLYDPDMHLRARLQAGLTLGHIGDPRFPAQIINGVEIIPPEMVAVPGGSYWIGSRDDDTDAYDDEKPRYTIDLLAFGLGRWPVTNAEYTCFIAAGGYKKEAYWEGDLAKRWLKGEDVTGGQYSSWMQIWQYMQDTPNWKSQLEQSVVPETIKTYEYIAELSEDEFKNMLSNQLSQKSRKQPHYWNDLKFNNPSQPVVGITWFEARAYCAWLSETTGKNYRLPSEVEWEAAGRGSLTPGPSPSGRGESGVRAYAWGEDWDQGKANTIEGRVLRTSPVGAYAAARGLGPYKAEDQTGNVWEWTSSLYLPYPYNPEQAGDPEATTERTLRGGAWDNDARRYVRCAYRNWTVPDFFFNLFEFRVLSPG